MIEVLNADWHHGDEDKLMPGASPSPAFRVLNADWHHGDEDPMVYKNARTICDACSTPIGITGTRTSTPVESTPTPTVCSTPIGITGTRTRQTPSVLGRRFVLNADWHHGDEDSPVRPKART